MGCLLATAGHIYWSPIKWLATVTISWAFFLLYCIRKSTVNPWCPNLNKELRCLPQNSWWFKRLNKKVLTSRPIGVTLCCFKKLKNSEIIKAYQICSFQLFVNQKIAFIFLDFNKFIENPCTRTVWLLISFWWNLYTKQWLKPHSYNTLERPHRNKS